MCRSFVLVGMLSLAAVATSRADEPKPAAGGDPPEVRATEAVTAAYTMARLGRENKSPVLLLAAARVIGTTDFQKIESKGADVAGLEEAVALLTEAKKLGGEKDEVVARMATAIEKEIKEFKRTATDKGPRSFVVSTEPKTAKTETLHFTFKGGQPAIVGVFSNPEGPFYTGEIYDAADKLVTSTSRCHDTTLVFSPTKTQAYKVVLKFPAWDKSVRYRVATN